MQNKKIFFESLEEYLDPLFYMAIRERIFPGAVVGVSLTSRNERKIFKKTYGTLGYEKYEKIKVRENTYYDLASLTKPLATSLAVLCLIKEGKVTLDTQVSAVLKEMVSKEKKRITVNDLLTHSSGLPAHKNFFISLQKIEKERDRKKNLLKMIDNERLDYETGKKSIYSDLGFMLLGLLIEEVSGYELDTFVKEKIYKPLGVDKKIFFAGSGITAENSVFAPTEYCPWRMKILNGEVSDENSSVLGGVSGHAGLFANIEGVLIICNLLLDMWKERDTYPNISNKDLRVFFTRYIDVKSSTWARGFDTPAQEESSAGIYLSKKSVGHLGFTGTSFWIDPEREIVVVLLSNRVHPTRDNNKIKSFRPLFHNAVIEGLRLK